MNETLVGKTVLVTGGARRVGRMLSLACASAGADLVVHYGHSQADALSLQAEILAAGHRAQILQADLGDPQQAVNLIEQACITGPLFALVNSAAIFEPLRWDTATLDGWDRHMTINLTSPFLLSQAFARQVPDGSEGRIVNILDWRALRPGADHLPYTISKAGLAALTRSLAAALAPRVLVNGLALGAILPPSDPNASPTILKHVPSGRWAQADEVGDALLFLLSGPAYITGEIVHVDGGRHLV